MLAIWHLTPKARPMATCAAHLRRNAAVSRKRALLDDAAPSGPFCGAAWGGHGRVREHVDDGYAQACCQRVDHGQRGIGYAGLDPAQIRPEQSAVFGQLLLGQPSGCAQGTNPVTKSALRRDSHPATLCDVHYFVHTLIHTFVVRVVG